MSSRSREAHSSFGSSVAKAAPVSRAAAAIANPAFPNMRPLRLEIIKPRGIFAEDRRAVRRIRCPRQEQIEEMLGVRYGTLGARMRPVGSPHKVRRIGG